MALSVRKWLAPFWLWLTLATVLGHALAPVGSPIARTSGSAFSASTHDVALGASRADPPAKAKRVQDGGEGDLPDRSGTPAFAVASVTLPIAEDALPIAAPDAPAVTPAPPQAFQARAPPRA